MVGMRPLEDPRECLPAMVKPHVDSYDWFAQTALDLTVAELEPHEFTDKSGTTITFWIEDVKIGKPFKGDNDNAVRTCTTPAMLSR